MAASDGGGELGPFVPVSARHLRSLEDAVEELKAREREAAASTRAILELSEDLSAEVLRRLRERGATQAQVERMRVAQRAAAAEVQRARRSLGEAIVAVEEAARALDG